MDLFFFGARIYFFGRASYFWRGEKSRKISEAYFYELSARKNEENSFFGRVFQPILAQNTSDLFLRARFLGTAVPDEKLEKCLDRMFTSFSS